ncbi:MAG: electron transfer flavoprotein subunit beta/FixA family protein [Defluviitaleaceae bacterium]|nr:electron transfer flavoprotein subunit beta/FixA family protein [Defluviitaleaceae bacterium]MCL2239589.1 electron transfer flavoprotein subunit beta/FixA family protein [Defluviitaleaceae bacterium]
MKIIVCIKQVPNTNEVKLDQQTGTLIREGVPSIINPDDLAGIEAALAIKDSLGAHITVVSMGPPQADIALREALAMGCDAACLITDRAFAGADTWATSSTLAGAAQLLGYDLIITGRQAIDGDTAQVGPQMAEHLGIAHIPYAEDIKADGEKIIVTRQFEDRYQLLQAHYPVLVTALSELNQPRYMSVGGVVDAYDQKEVRLLTYADLETFVPVENIGLKGSPTRVKKSFTKSPKGKGELHQVSEDEAVEIIIQKLKGHLIL